MNKMVKFFDMIPFLGVGFDLIPRTDLQRYRFNCFSSPNNTASHAVMRCYIREKARLGEAVIHLHQPAYRLTGGKEVEPFAPYPTLLSCISPRGEHCFCRAQRLGRVERSTRLLTSAGPSLYRTVWYLSAEGG